MPSSTLADFIHAFRAVRIVSVDLYADELRNEGIGADYEVAPPFVAAGPIRRSWVVGRVRSKMV